jgi:hypothetical protein
MPPVTFRRADTLQELVTLVLFDVREWLAFTSDGFFDGTLPAWQRVAFRFPLDPETLYEPEQFFSVFFEPGLLSTVLREATPFRELLKRAGDPRAVADLDRLRRSALPYVTIAGPANGGGNRQAFLDVSVVDGGSGMQDLRVFRNRSLVYAVAGALAAQGATKTFRVRVPVTLTCRRKRDHRLCIQRREHKNEGSEGPCAWSGSAPPAARSSSASASTRYASGQNLKYAGWPKWRTALASLPSSTESVSISGSRVPAVGTKCDEANIKRAWRGWRRRPRQRCASPRSRSPRACSA